MEWLKEILWGNVVFEYPSGVFLIEKEKNMMPKSCETQIYCRIIFVKLILCVRLDVFALYNWE